MMKMPPHHEFIIPPHALPIRNRNKVKFLVISFLVSTTITLLFDLLLYFYKIPTIVILPTSAPIWIGLTTIGYMVQIEK